MDRSEEDRAEQALIIREAFTNLDPVCSYCKDKGDVVEDDIEGIFTCRRCGHVAQNMMISDESEWRSFANGDTKGGSDPNRVGDSGGASMEGDVQATVLGAGADGISRQTQAALDQKRQKKLQEAQRLCEMLCTHCHCNQRIRDDAMALFDKVDQQLKRKPLQAVMAACLLAAIKKNNRLLTMNQIAPIAGVSALEIKKCWKVVSETAKDVYKSAGGVGSQRSLDGAQLVPKLCSLLRLPMEVQNAAVEMCPSILRLQEGKDPATIASTALYLASRLHHTERRQIDDIAAVATVGVDTIKRCVRDVHPRRSEFVPRGYATTTAVENLPTV